MSGHNLEVLGGIFVAETSSDRMSMAKIPYILICYPPKTYA